MLNFWDYLVIVIYFVFMISIGFIWSRINKNSSDFFRGGGNMLWWINGMSSLAAGLSAYSFTAAGAKVFENGLLLLLIYLCGVLPMFIVYFFFAARFRQMRVVTVADAIRKRYGKGTEQFWVWVSLLQGLFIGGLGLYVVSLFISAATGMPIIATIIVLAITVAVMATSGGSWAVAASDFIQMLIIVVVSVTILILTLMLPEVGGVSGFVTKLPSHYINFSEFERPAIWIALLSTFIIMNVINSINLNTQGAKYLTVKDGDNAKKSALVFIFGSALLPFIAFTPVMVAGILNLDLVARFPDLPNPSEGAYLAVAELVMPSGMLGLLVCAIFAAAMSSMDTALNKNAGFMVRNFYRDILRPDAGEKDMLRFGRFLTMTFGVVIALVAILFSYFRGADLFSVLLKINVLMAFPLIVPMTLGLLIKKTPGWSGWSTVVFAFLIAWGSQTFLTAEMVANTFGLALPLNELEQKDLIYISSGLLTLAAGILWFLGTALFYTKTTSKEFRGGVETFFEDMDTPIDHVREQSVDQDGIQYRNMSQICLIYGVFLCLGCLIPNPLGGRFVFIACASVFLLIGWILRRKYQRNVADQA